MDNRLVCSLPMYDLPELAGHTQALWQALWQAMAARLRGLGIDAPDALLRPDDLDAHWRAPNLLLSQTCGYPLLRLPRSVRVVATPVYAAPGCQGADYRSAIIVRHTEASRALAGWRGAVCAINGRDSNSGMNLLRAEVAKVAAGAPFFGRVIETGSHAASIAAVAGGQADIAAIDGVTLALLQRHRPALTDPVRVLGWTVASPGLPLVTAQPDPVPELLWQGLAEIQCDPGLAITLRALLIQRFERLPGDAYDAVRRIEAQAAALSYPELR